MNKVFEDLLYQAAPPVARITLNRPHKLNAVTQRLYTEIREALVQADADPAIEVVVLTGAGRAFCVGGDLTEVHQMHSADASSALVAAADNSSQTFMKFETIDKPIICLVNGIAHAGGMIFAVQSDIIIASDRAVFRLPEALRGIVDPFVATRLQAHIGLARTKYVCLTCAEITAQEAADWGLVVRVVPHEQLDEEAARIVTQILATKREARRWNKRLLHRSLGPVDPYVLRDVMTHGETRDGTAPFDASKPASPGG
jgi:enoyl-CoA hydratase